MDIKENLWNDSAIMNAKEQFSVLQKNCSKATPTDVLFLGGAVSREKGCQCITTKSIDLRRYAAVNMVKGGRQSTARTMNTIIQTLFTGNSYYNLYSTYLISEAKFREN